MKTQFLALLLARVFATAVQALTFILLARWAGVRDFGTVGIIAGICAVLFTVADWGLSSYIPRARAVGKNDDVVAGIRMDFVGNAVAGTLAATVIGALSVPLGISAWFILVPLGLAIEQFVEVALTVPIADKNKRSFVFSLVLRRVVSVVIFVSLHLLAFEAVASYAIAVLTASAVGFLHVVGVLRNRLGGMRTRSSSAELYRRLIPYLLANLSAQSRTLDTAVVGAVSSLSSAGLYSAAFRLVNPLMLVSSSLVAVLLPHASRKDLRQTRRIGRVLSCGAIILCVAMIPVISNAGQVMEFLFGREFAAAAPAFALAIAALPFLSLAPPLGGLLQSQGFERFVAVNGVTFAALNLALVFVGATFWGPAGAAAGVAVTYAGKSMSLLIRLETARRPDEPSQLHGQTVQLRTA
ncbi:lipopolysaccharide biosynthesis protein [Pseudarthrobacter sp. NPDC092439]|uniref:lipopolysaccharide biosynthesis protein n=1 Tax=unclassified Pseudarthrobacter TaxID=2647000 RepID=UPI003810AB85